MLNGSFHSIFSSAKSTLESVNSEIATPRASARSARRADMPLGAAVESTTECLLGPHTYLSWTILVLSCGKGFRTTAMSFAQFEQDLTKALH